MAKETKAEKKKRLKAEKAAERQARIDAGEDVGEDDEEEVEGETFTYVGAGTEPPRKINFMGRQVFIRGKATVVSDPVVLAKLKDHPCFVEGEVDADDLEEQDAEADEAAEAQRAEDVKTQRAAAKAMGQIGKGAERD